MNSLSQAQPILSIASAGEELKLGDSLQIPNGTAVEDFGCGQGGEAGASSQRAVMAEPTRATGKSAAARRVVAQNAVWLCCSSVTGQLQPCFFVAPRHPTFCSTTVPIRICRQAPGVPTVTASLKHLAKLGIARETTGRNYGRIYAYDKYLKLLNEGTEPLS